MDLINFTELTGKCVTDGWDPTTKTLPIGDRDLRDYFTLEPTIIPVDDIVLYDIVNDTPVPVDGHTGLQQEYLLRLCSELRNMRNYFISTGNTVTAIAGFKITSPNPV